LTTIMIVATQSQTQDVAWRIMTARTLQDFFVTSWTAFANQAAISTRTARTVNTAAVTWGAIVPMEVLDIAVQAAEIWETLAQRAIAIPTTCAPHQGSQRYKRSR